MRLTKIIAFSSAGLLLAPFLSAQTPQGPDITASTQGKFPSFSQVATAASGNFVVAWEQQNGNGPRRAVVRQFAANGKARGREIPVSPSNPGASQISPRVAVAAGGNFFVVWQMRNSVFGRAFGAAGRALGPAFRLAPGSQAIEVSPAVAALADGSFVATWTSGVNPAGFQNDDILAARFTAQGQAIGTAFPVVSPAAFFQDSSRVAASGNGDFLVGWESAENGSATISLKARRFDASGNALGSSFNVASSVSRDNELALALADDGEALFVWNGPVPGAPPTSSGLPQFGVLGQRVSSADAPLGSAFLISETPDDHAQESPAADAVPGGGYFVTWSNGLASPSKIFGQSIGADGSLQGDLLQVNADGSKAGSRPAVSIAPNGQGVVTWTASLRRSTAILVRRLVP
jgi:hypothetical protein